MNHLPWGLTSTAAPTQRTSKRPPGDSLAPLWVAGMGVEAGSGLGFCAKPASHFGACVPSSLLAPLESQKA